MRTCALSLSLSLSLSLAFSRVLSRAAIRAKLSSLPHRNVFPFPKFVESEKAGYLIRQYFAYSLLDRIKYAAVSDTTNSTRQPSPAPSDDVVYASRSRGSSRAYAALGPSCERSKRNGSHTNCFELSSKLTAKECATATSRPRTSWSRVGTGSISRTLPRPSSPRSSQRYAIDAEPFTAPSIPPLSALLADYSRVKAVLSLEFESALMIDTVCACVCVCVCARRAARHFVRFFVLL